MNNRAQLAEIWREQCAAAVEIKDNFGITKALGYLIGEKLLRFVQAAEDFPEFEDELPDFISEIKANFQPWEISGYLDNVKRVGALGHACTDEEYKDFKDAGAVPQDTDFGISDIITMDKIKELFYRY